MHPCNAGISDKKAKDQWKYGVSFEATAHSGCCRAAQSQALTSVCLWTYICSQEATSCLSVLYVCFNFRHSSYRIKKQH